MEEERGVKRGVEGVHGGIDWQHLDTMDRLVTQG